MPSPSLYITNFADERCRFDSYWSRLRKLDVPVPKTTFVPLETDEDGIHWETDEILAFMDRNEYDRAFVRTQVRAALYGTKPEAERGETGGANWW